jgi:hypothetical protein
MTLPVGSATVRFSVANCWLNSVEDPAVASNSSKRRGRAER